MEDKIKTDQQYGAISPQTLEPLKQGKGIVISLQRDRHFGFIQQEDNTQIFFYATGVCVPDFKDLKEGSRVEYMITDAPKGPKAIGIVAI